MRALSETGSRRRLGWTIRPTDLLRAWPADRPLACLISAGGSPAARWSIISAPTDMVRLRPGASDPLAALDAALAATSLHEPRRQPPTLPFESGWIGWLSYDLGRVIEPSARAAPGASADRARPLAELARCPGAYVHDARLDRWWLVGDDHALPKFDADDPAPTTADPHGWRVGAFTSRTGRAAYEAAAARVIEYIRAGDVFQVNLAHRLSAEFSGSPRAMAAAWLDHASARFGAYIESCNDAGAIHSAIGSVSPELFLSVDGPTRRVVTRPIKGTIPAAHGAADALRASAKDAAELTMIVDLMRNDLGRVCEYGSVRVEEARRIDTHPGLGVVHGEAAVAGTLREGVTHAALLRAAFPPGSVTGAPKIRAMQIIDELEPVRRGPYCGAVGFVSDAGDASWNVAIRTADLAFEPGSTIARARGVIDYAVGAGIVADSDPALEWHETLAKARVLSAIARVNA